MRCLIFFSLAADFSPQVCSYHVDRVLCGNRNDSTVRICLAESFAEKKENRADTQSCSVTAKDLAKKLQKRGIDTVKFEGSPRYHGRVKAFIEVCTG
jgi:ribosomal protein L18